MSQIVQIVQISTNFVVMPNTGHIANFFAAYKHKYSNCEFTVIVQK